MIGQTLANRYEITALIGRGAMGDVYRATDTQTGQTVAVKVLARQLALNEEMVERFRREGESLRQLRHPNIVEFLDTFQHESQQVIIMEYVPGGSLHDLIKKQGALPLDRARRMALELCDALTRAHHLEIVHRDLKPENILIAEDGAPKLTDFGVARLVGEGTRLTGTGAQIGTPYYMAPEAWEGKPLDAQADVWSLGVVLFEMLSGEVPFGGETAAALMTKILMTTTPDLRQMRTGVPEGLAQIIGRMLTRDRAARYQTMREVGLDLERGAPTAVPMRPAMQPARPTRRIPAWAWGIIIGTVLLGGIVIAGGRLWQQQATLSPESQAALALTSPVSWAATASRTPRPSNTPRLTATPGPTQRDSLGGTVGTVLPHASLTATATSTPLGLPSLPILRVVRRVSFDNPAQTPFEAGSRGSATWDVAGGVLTLSSHASLASEGNGVDVTSAFYVGSDNGIVVLFRVMEGTVGWTPIQLRSGEWGLSSFRAFELNYGNGSVRWQVYSGQTSGRESITAVVSQVEGFRFGVWHYVLLRIIPSGKVEGLLWEKDNSEGIVTFNYEVGQDWAARSFRLGIGAWDESELQVDEVQEVELAE